MAQKKRFSRSSTPDKPRPADRTQDRSSNLRLGPLTREQAISGIFKISPVDVNRIREEEKKLKYGKKKGPMEIFYLLGRDDKFIVPFTDRILAQRYSEACGDGDRIESTLVHDYQEGQIIFSVVRANGTLTGIFTDFDEAFGKKEPGGEVLRTLPNPKPGNRS